MNTETLIPDLFEAFEFASLAHHGVLRGGKGTPYVNHTIDVAKRVASAGFTDRDTLVAAFLHDTVEDTRKNPRTGVIPGLLGEVTVEMIREKFGSRVAELVGNLTLPPEAQDDREKKHIYQIQKMKEMDAHGQAIKVGDKNSNVFDLYADPPKWGVKAIRGYSDSSREVVLAADCSDPRVENLVQKFERSYRTVANHYGWMYAAT